LTVAEPLGSLAVDRPLEDTQDMHSPLQVDSEVRLLLGRIGQLVSANDDDPRRRLLAALIAMWDDDPRLDNRLEAAQHLLTLDQRDVWFVADDPVTALDDAASRLLVALGGDRDSAAQKYLEIRTNLVRFFEWRGCSFPEDHADETINRIAKRVAEGEEILNYSGYAVGVARLLLLEINKGRQREQLALAEIGQTSEAYEEKDDGEHRLVCLRSCLETLTTDNRALILQYYQGEKGEKIQNRKKLMDQFGIPVNTLRMRALRLREKLQSCVEECVGSA